MNKLNLSFETVDEIPNEKSKYAFIFPMIEELEMGKVLKIGPFEERHQADPMMTAIYKRANSLGSYKVKARMAMLPSGVFYLFIKKIPKEPEIFIPPVLREDFVDTVSISSDRPVARRK